MRPEVIKQGKLLGRGGFGFVFQGTCRGRVSGAPMDVALKMLQPVDPGTTARQSAIVAYKVGGGLVVQHLAGQMHIAPDFSTFTKAKFAVVGLKKS